MKDDLGTAVNRSVVERTSSLDEVDRWLRGVEAAGDFVVQPCPLESLDGWAIDPATHDLSHRSGRFFAIRGADVTVAHDGRETHWQQPVIVQPDVGVLGLVSAPIDGVLKVLVQAKMEPGNRRLVQVSPTVQATASNFERVHQGQAIPFIEYFQQQPPGHLATLVDQLQTEQGTRYLRKRNRNAIVVVNSTDVDVVDDRFRWMTLADLVALAAGDDLLHMDTRSILGSLPMSTPTSESSQASVVAPGIDRWIRDLEQRTQVTTREIAMCDVDGWILRDGRITATGHAPFTVLGVKVAATHREVAAWDQPLVQNADGTTVTLVVRRTSGATEALITASASMGVRDGMELGPSIVEWPAGERDVTLDSHPEELAAAVAQGVAHFDNTLPEEGGRFFHSSTHHRIVEIDDADAVPDDAGRRWIDLAQLRALGANTSRLNMELRSLLACLPNDLRAEH